MNCKHCGKWFEATRYRRVYCGVPCKNAAHTKIDMERLRWYAFQGREGKEIAKLLGVSAPRICRVLRKTRGLYQLWHENRYA